MSYAASPTSRSCSPRPATMRALLPSASSAPLAPPRSWWRRRCNPVSASFWPEWILFTASPVGEALFPCGGLHFPAGADLAEHLEHRDAGFACSEAELVANLEAEVVADAVGGKQRSAIVLAGLASSRPLGH